MSDAELLLGGGPDEFMMVCERHAPAIRAWLRLKTRDPDTAAELLAETLAAAWAGRHRFRDRGHGSAAPWLFGIAAKKLALYWRRRRVASTARAQIGMVTRSYDGDPFDEADDRLVLESVAPEVRAALACLKPAQQEVLKLRVVEELDYGTVARRLGIREGAARMRVSRALATLRGLLEAAR